MYLLPGIARRRRLKRQTGPGLKISLAAASIWSILLSFCLFSLTFVFSAVVRDLPSIQALPVLLDPTTGFLMQPTQIFDRSGQHLLLNLDNPLVGERGYAYLDPSKPDYVPETLINATLAASQPDFYSRPISFLANESSSTITRKLIHTLLFQQETPGLILNLREQIYAAQLVAYYGRDQILEWFLNSAAYGPHVFGVQSAAWAYFGKPPSDLSLPEAALIAALAEMPEVNPSGLPDLLTQRQREVIAQMLASGMITTEEAAGALNTTLILMPARSSLSSAPAFTNLVLAQLARVLPETNPEQGGLRIITTLDADIQGQADCLLKRELTWLNTPDSSAVSLPVDTCRAARLLPTLDPIAQPVPAGGGIILIDPETGQIQAMAANSPSEIMDAARYNRPAGSLLNSLIYLTAFSRGFTPASMVWDIPGISPNGLTYHGPQRLRTALANDYPGPAAQLLAQLGRDSVLRTANQLGLQIDLSGTGTSSTTTLKQAGQFYAMLSNQGVTAGQVIDGRNLEAYTILRVERSDGQVLLDWNRPQYRSVISPQLAYLMNNILSDESARWPSLGHPNPLEIGRVTAASLGYTASGEDAWVFGYTPNWVIGVWMGVERPPENAILSESAAAIWHAFAQYYSQNQPSDTWRIPPGVLQLDVCDPSGMLPTAICPAVVSEVFLDGTQPTQTDTLYRVYQINRATGKLATVFTPPELIENRVYLVTSPEAAEWAFRTGQPIPPSDYDNIYTPPANPDVQITQPLLYAHVRNSVKLIGSARGPGFSYYRIQIGQGLNPQEWLQIGINKMQPVNAGELAEWQTEGLSGLYAIQLLVVYEDQRVEIATTQVTIDNTAPALAILNPEPDVQTAANQILVFQASANDNLAIERVEFWVDGKLIGSLVQAPYHVAWLAQTGRHTLLVKAFDLAGNFAQEKLDFTVK